MKRNARAYPVPTAMVMFGLIISTLAHFSNFPSITPLDHFPEAGKSLVRRDRGSNPENRSSKKG